MARLAEALFPRLTGENSHVRTPRPLPVCGRVPEDALESHFELLAQGRVKLFNGQPVKDAYPKWMFWVKTARQAHGLSNVGNAQG